MNIDLHHEAKKTYQAQEAREELPAYLFTSKTTTLQLIQKLALIAACTSWMNGQSGEFFLGHIIKKIEVNDNIKCIALDQYLEGQYQRAQNWCKNKTIKCHQSHKAI
ncbi:hypothetical protein ACJX0J_020774 [Zea mays]